MSIKAIPASVPLTPPAARRRTQSRQTARSQTGLCLAATPLGHRAPLRLGHALPPSRQGLRALRQHPRRLQPRRLRLPHAQTSSATGHRCITPSSIPCDRYRVAGVSAYPRQQALVGPALVSAAEAVHEFPPAKPAMAYGRLRERGFFASTGSAAAVQLTSSASQAPSHICSPEIRKLGFAPS